MVCIRIRRNLCSKIELIYFPFCSIIYKEVEKAAPAMARYPLFANRIERNRAMAEKGNNKFFKMFKDTAETVKKTAEEQVEVVKINSNIGNLRDQITAAYKAIGESVYQSEGDTISKAELQPQLDTIRECQEKIKELQARSAELRGVKVCPACKAECGAKAEFCAKCGTKLS